MVRDRRFPDLYMIPATQNREKFVAGAREVAGFYAALKEKHDYILVDGPAGVGREMRIAASGVDLAVIVTTLEHVSLRDADRTDQILLDSGVSRRVCVVNKVRRELLRSGALPGFEDLSALLKSPLLGIIQYDENIHIAANCGIPIVRQKGNYIEENFNKIADRLLRC
jgi:septum site-determining protein MinD